MRSLVALMLPLLLTGGSLVAGCATHPAVREAPSASCTVPAGPFQLAALGNCSTVRSAALDAARERRRDCVGGIIRACYQLAARNDGIPVVGCVGSGITACEDEYRQSRTIALAR